MGIYVQSGRDAGVSHYLADGDDRDVRLAQVATQAVAEDVETKAPF